ncbi:DNA recombination protein RmuC [Methylocella tundrae]|uniref:DNA recombination protein RmuC homolog n=1 Tax=Methylocella tundrae TaxID=227605 RepID=A0A8B6MAN4_METTU|nr:DNA recombination protein RmuC [Methylocella tundrae]VTZ22595.1 DNA recombination protein RmuC [Methylocella tundrae]VTZ51585.1 DNA recombination protein RmuC [Methylocella tundrae]
MDRLVLTLNGAPIAVSHLLLAAAALALGLLVFMAASASRAAHQRRLEAASAAERQREMERVMAILARQNAELSGRVRSVAETLGSRQSDLARFVAERLDAVGARVGAGVEASGKTAGEQLAKLNERLAVIDAAQARLTGLTQEVVGLKDILANKQARGAFGQGRLETIVKDALPQSAYAFQHTLSNRMRPDCVIRLPGDSRLMVIDAKFPLEAFTALKAAADAEARKYAAARVRADVGKHIKDIAERYFLPDETQDIALLFVPAESLYADINEHFDDIVQKAHRNRIIIVSPSLLMMAVQVMQAIVRDERVREQTHIIQAEVRRLVDDVAKLRARATKLGAHFQNAQEDVAGLLAAADRIAKCGERIDQMDFAEAADITGVEKLKAAE